MALFIVANPKRKLVKGDFGGQVIDGAFHVPEEIHEVLVSFGVTEVDSFYESLFRVPVQERLQAAFEARYGWSVSDFMGAASKLGYVLDGHLPERKLYPFGRPGRARRRHRGKARG